MTLHKNDSVVTRAVAALAGFSGFMHDIGKLTNHFQTKLHKGAITRDAISHEWISAWILAQMLRQEKLDWTGFQDAWQTWAVSEFGLQSLERNRHTWRPFEQLDNFESAALMVVATHHRLFSPQLRGLKEAPVLPSANEVAPLQNHVDGHDHSFRSQAWHCVYEGDIDEYEKWHWDALLQSAQAQLFSLKECVTEISQMPSTQKKAFWHKAALMARAALIQADHRVSSQAFIAVGEYAGSLAYANTTRTSEREALLHQPLVWHLKEVGELAMAQANQFAATDLPALSGDSRAQLRAYSSKAPKRFAWQQNAYEYITKLRVESEQSCAFLIFNVAGTGAGKTRANMRMLEACHTNTDSLRVTAGFNLKTLTLQTASVYRAELCLTLNECACVIGDPLARFMHTYEKQNDDDAEQAEIFAVAGCDSQAFLNALPDWLQSYRQQKEGKKEDDSVASLIGAPVLVATMDYLVAAGEPQKQALHAQALLRLAHSDLIIDEADSYDPHALVSVLRLVQLAAAFGRNVVIASATLSPVLAQAIETAWKSGLAMYQASGEMHVAVHTVLVSNQGMAEGFQASYAQAEGQVFIDWYRAQMASAYMTNMPVLRLAKIQQVQSLSKYPATIVHSCLEAHENHYWIGASNGKKIRVSIGLVRMANVEPLMLVAGAIADNVRLPTTHIKLCAYHARDVAMRRLLKERALDDLLKRHDSRSLQDHPIIQTELQNLPEGAEDLLLIVVASPVEEIGRDHDFDWAVTELSSSHAFIQLAGRVNRHRLDEITQPNIFVLNRNYKLLKNNQTDRVCFVRPGLQQTEERNGRQLATTHLIPTAMHLLAPEGSALAGNEQLVVDARLLFDPARRCHFAIEDDRAVAMLLQEAMPFLESDHTQWACDWFYRQFTLRDQVPDASWRVVPCVAGRIRIEKYEPNVSRSPWLDRGERYEERPSDEKYQWLSWSIEEADALMKDILVKATSSGAGAAWLMDKARQVSVPAFSTKQDITIAWTGIEQV